jgi:hypothetical protein
MTIDEPAAELNNWNENVYRAIVKAGEILVPP